VVIDHDVAKSMPGMQRQLTPFSDRLATTTRPWTPILSDMLFELEFDRFEFLVGLAFYDLRHAKYGNWAPTGRVTWRGRYGGGVGQLMLAELAEPAGSRTASCCRAIRWLRGTAPGGPVWVRRPRARRDGEGVF
jgi:hypothetical protein